MTVVGVDEVGRGSWAGPLLVVAAQTIYDLPDGLNDSKLLSQKQREELLEQIIFACKLGEGWVQPEEIDEHGLTKAMRLGVGRALIDLGVEMTADIVMDGDINHCPPEYINSRAVIKADSTYPVVSAASVYAKVKRDAYMARLAQFYPDYGFEKHVGYGTKLHMEMLAKYGVSQVHRKSYKPIARLAGTL